YIASVGCACAIHVTTCNKYTTSLRGAATTTIATTTSDSDYATVTNCRCCGSAGDRYTTASTSCTRARSSSSNSYRTACTCWNTWATS
ncbi:MAG: hypothetical protein ACYTBZ_02545, partial [Planctomycetota bacterium]